jgi:hypothetical protein
MKPASLIHRVMLGLFAAMLGQWRCDAYNEFVHTQISRRAFISSYGLSAFL